MDASEHAVECCGDCGGRVAEYVIDGKVVGRRYWDDDGQMDWERPFKDGLLHGVQYTWFDGQLESAEPYVQGKVHGVAKQWSPSGKLMGSYKMIRGTGIDLWWHSLDGRGEAPFYLSEVHYMRDGELHGYTWWINEDQVSICVERHYVDGLQHGIEREWNAFGRLSRGFPRYFINGNQVDKRRYLRAANADRTLPRFQSDENAPARTFPEEIRKHLSTERDHA